jgi:lipoate-protein ligase B
VPCGIRGKHVGSIVEYQPEADYSDVADSLLKNFCSIFDVEIADVHKGSDALQYLDKLPLDDS